MILCGPQLEWRGKARSVLLVTRTKAVVPPSRQIQVQTGCGTVGARGQGGDRVMSNETASTWEDGDSLELGGGTVVGPLIGFKPMTCTLKKTVEVVAFIFILHVLFHG